MVEIECDPEIVEGAGPRIRRWLEGFAAKLDPDGRGRVELHVSASQDSSRVRIACGGASPPVHADVSAPDVGEALTRAFQHVATALGELSAG